MTIGESGLCEHEGQSACMKSVGVGYSGGNENTSILYMYGDFLFAFTLAQHLETDSGVVASFTVVCALWCIYNSLWL